MDGWEDESEEAQAARANKVPVVKKKWVDEDEESSEEVASDWEAEEEEKKKPAPKPAAQVIAPKKKMSSKQKIAEQQALRDARIANGEESPDTEDDIIDPILKKRLEREREVEADLKNASELLGGTSLDSAPTTLDDLLVANPKTKDDFIAFSNDLIELVVKRLQDRPLYAQFVEHHVRALAAPLKDVDVRKAASGLTTLANEKQKEQREGGKKKKGAAKPALGGVKASSRTDTRVYDEVLDNFGDDPDDFM